MNVVVVPFDLNTMVIHPLGFGGSPYVVSGSAGTALAAQHVAINLAALAVVGLATVATFELLRTDEGSIRKKWEAAGSDAKNKTEESKSILQIWREEGERAKEKK